jgi:hypothetical protein
MIPKPPKKRKTERQELGASAFFCDARDGPIATSETVPGREKDPAGYCI